MKNFLFFVFILMITASCAEKTPEPIPEINKPVVKELRHVVLFKFKDGLSKDTVTAIEMAFKGLKSQIPSIQGFEWGLNNSPEKLDQGYTHCFVVTFHSEKDRDEYLPNPAHQAFVNKFAKLYVDKVCVFDFWADK
jgi:Stress responsive A/B Barrel Domain